MYFIAQIFTFLLNFDHFHNFFSFLLKKNPQFLKITLITLLLGLAQSLCAFGCVVDTVTSDGNYPLHLAAKNGHTEVVRCLCLAGCKIDVKNKDGVTPELAALSQGHGEISDLLKRLKRVRKLSYPFFAAYKIQKESGLAPNSWCDP